MGSSCSLKFAPGKYKKVSASVDSRLAAKKAVEECSAKATGLQSF